LITILHTNDFHNRLTADKIEKLRARREALGSGGLMLDAGDAGGSGNVTFRRDGEPILTDMSSIGYDAMTVGNRDFHLTRVGFRSKVFRAAFPILCANVRPSKPCDGDADSIPARPLIERSVLGRKIVVFGLTVPMITVRMWERKLSSYIFDDPIATARRLIPRIRDEYQPDVLIALTHIGIKQDRSLAAAAPEIDLIVGGHSHVVLETGESVNGVLIVQAGSIGRYLGTVRISGERAEDGHLAMEASLEEI
jgi:2',3'-cyclic-nucleotide 2'-phosphodiesterase (5'-nucleotidase family)